MIQPEKGAEVILDFLMKSFKHFKGSDVGKKIMESEDKADMKTVKRDAVSCGELENELGQNTIKSLQESENINRYVV